MGFKRIVAKSEDDLVEIIGNIKDWFKNNKIYKTESTSEKRKFMDPETKKIIEKDIDGLKIIDQNNKKETTIKFIPLLKPNEIKIELGGENETTMAGKIKNQMMGRGVLKSYNKDTKGKNLGAPGFNIIKQSTYVDKKESARNTIWQLFLQKYITTMIIIWIISSLF